MKAVAVIDNIFTNCPNYNMDSCILIDDISDHLPIMLCMDLFLTTSRVSTTPNKRIFNDKGKDAFKQLLQITDWSTIEQLADSEGPDVAYASFISKYKSLYDLDDPGLPDSFKLGDRVTLDKFTIANAFNYYFTNIGPTLANKIPCTSKTIDAFMPVLRLVPLAYYPLHHWK